MKLRYEALIQGNGYVGKEASEDDDWMQKLFSSLQKEWASDPREGHFVDNF